MQISLMSWNINGIRAAIKKGLWEKLTELNPDMICFQEIKAGHDIMQSLFPKLENSSLSLENETEQIPWTQKENLNIAWHSCTMKAGYSGVATLWPRLSKEIGVQEKQVGLGLEKFDIEGRIIVTKVDVNSAEKDTFYLINGYFPQGGRGQFRIDYKIEFYGEVLKFAKQLKSKGFKVIICGDLNTTVSDIDLARPNENRQTTGCLPEEREALNWFFDAGFVDSFRHFYPNLERKYTYWDQITRARERNVGWRIDYFLVDKDLLPNLKQAEIHEQIMGSDHCPVSITLEFCT